MVGTAGTWVFSNMLYGSGSRRLDPETIIMLVEKHEHEHEWRVLTPFGLLWTDVSEIRKYTRKAL